MRISDWSSDVCSSDLHPRRENVAFYADPAAARAAGFRACLRCKPDEVGRDRIAVARAIALIEAAEEAIALDDLAARVDRKSTRRNSSHSCASRMPSSA